MNEEEFEALHIVFFSINEKKIIIIDHGIKIPQSQQA